VIHKAAPSFCWAAYRGLTPEIGKLADKCFEVLKDNPSHQSLCLKTASAQKDGAGAVLARSGWTSSSRGFGRDPGWFVGSGLGIMTSMID